MFINKLIIAIQKAFCLYAVDGCGLDVGPADNNRGFDCHLYGEGQNQSPVNITETVKVDLPKLVFNYKPMPLIIENTRNTLHITADKAGSMEIGGEVSQLLQFHFHVPSEHTVDGKRFDMVIHLVHQNANDRLTVVSAFFNVGTEANPVIETLLKLAPKVPDVEVKKCNEQIDINQLLPENLGYYTLDGSLTTPPYSEGVRWILLKQPLSITAEQLARYPYPNSARPLQPLNNRKVFSSL